MTKKLYNYKNTQNVKTTIDIGEITPVFWREYYPGETLKNLNYKTISRMITPEFPTLDNANIQLFTFKVPFRLIYNTLFQKNNSAILKEGARIYITGEDSFKEQSNLDEQRLKEKYPQLKNTHIKGLFNKFGIEKLINESIGLNSSMKINIMPILAYHEIYRSFFRHKELEKDIYTELAFNDKQDTTQLIHEINIIDNDKNIGNVKQLFSEYLNQIGLINQENDIFEKLQFSTFKNVQMNNFLDFLRENGSNIRENKLVAAQLTNGTNKDILLNVWNSNNHDKTDPELIGYAKYQQAITQVTTPNNDFSTGRRIGDVGGQSIVYNEGTLAQDETFNEHCIVLTVAVANYPLTINNYYSHYEWLDQEYEIGKESTLQQNIYRFNFGTMDDLPNQIVAYQPAFDDLRNPKNKILGEMKGNWNYWIYEQNEDITEVNTNYIKLQKAPFKKTLTTKDVDAFIFEFNFYTEELRHIEPFNVTIEELTEREND